jgi:hypothetical protein
VALATTTTRRGRDCELSVQGATVTTTVTGRGRLGPEGRVVVNVFRACGQRIVTNENNNNEKN